MNEVSKKIGKRLQAQRKRAGLTQAELSEKIGISEHYLSAVERGVNQLKYETLIAAMNILGCSADDIFCDVTTRGQQIITCELNERLNGLDAEEKARILTVLDTLIKTAKQK